MRKQMNPEEILKKKAAPKSDWGGFWFGINAVDSLCMCRERFSEENSFIDGY
jgi:hypothetical protein